MSEKVFSKATLGRIPQYIDYLMKLPDDVERVSAASISRELNLGDVQVRKDLQLACGAGRPKIGYLKSELIKSLEDILGNENGNTIIVGAGKLGQALLDYTGFENFGLSLLAAFDKRFDEPTESVNNKKILPMSYLKDFCIENKVDIGIIAVPKEAAQEVFDELYENGIRAFWCFAAPKHLNVPDDAVIQFENMALSLAHLKTKISK